MIVVSQRYWNFSPVLGTDSVVTSRMVSNCAVCNKGKSCYKCPKCRSVYCSLQCNKVHKTVCPSETQAVDVERVQQIAETKVLPSQLLASDECRLQKDIGVAGDQCKAMMTTMDASGDVAVTNEQSFPANTFPLMTSNTFHDVIGGDIIEDCVEDDDLVVEEEIKHIEESILHNSFGQNVDIQIAAEHTSDSSKLQEISLVEVSTNKNPLDSNINTSSAEISCTTSSSDNISNTSPIETVSGKISNHNIDSSEMIILSDKTIQLLLKSEYLKNILKSSRLRDDILNIDSAINRQSALKKLRLQKPDFNIFLDKMLVDIVNPSLP